MFLLKAEPWRSLGTHSELGIRYTVWKSCSFHCKDNDLPLQRLLKENKCYHQKHFWLYFINPVFFSWKTVKLVATYLKRKHIAKPFALSYSLMSLFLEESVIWMRFSSMTLLATIKTSMPGTLPSGMISDQLFRTIKIKPLPFGIVTWLVSPAFGNGNRCSRILSMCRAVCTRCFGAILCRRELAFR